MLKKIKIDSQKIFKNRKRRNRFKLKISNKSKKPRLSIFKSCSHIYVQIIDDNNSMTLASVCTLSKEIVSFMNKKMNNIQTAKLIGKLIAEKALEKNIKEVIFDRGGYIFHGKIKAIADTARENGLNF